MPREDLSKPKVHYGVQVALYTDILEQKGLPLNRTAFVIDINADEIAYDLDEPLGLRKPTTLWVRYRMALAKARAIVSHETETLAAYSSTCKLRWWYSACTGKLEKYDDLTLLPELRRTKGDEMLVHVGHIAEFASMAVESFITGEKTLFTGIGPDILRKLHGCAILVISPNPQPYLSAPLTLPPP